MKQGAAERYCKARLDTPLQEGERELKMLPPEGWHKGRGATAKWRA